MSKLVCPQYGDAHRNYVIRIGPTTIQCVKCMDTYGVQEVDDRFGSSIINSKIIKVDEALSSSEG